MRYTTIMLALLTLLSFSVWADAGKDIVTGAFSTHDHAVSRNTKLNEYLQKDPEIAPLLKEGAFDFEVNYVRGYYRTMLTHFDDAADIPVVLAHIKKVLPDAYVTNSLQPKTQESAAADQGTETAATPEGDIVAVDQTAAAEQPAAVETPAQDNTTAAAPAEPAPVPAVKNDVKPVPVPAPSPAATPAASSGGTSYLTYGIIAAAVVLIILLFLAFRPKKAAAPEEEETTDEEAWVTDEMEPAPAEEAEPADDAVRYETPAAEEAYPEPAETPYESFEEVPVIAEPIEELTEPEPIETYEPPVETFEPPVEEAPAETYAPAAEEAPAAPVKRKKRNLPSDIKTASIEDLAEFEGNRILVAEDNIINQKVLSRLLANSGIDVVMAENGQIAIDMLSEDPNYGMILMDAHMPVKDGFEASREIRQDPRFDHIVIVALSGDVSSDDIRKMREAGMEEQLAKPLKVDALYNVMYQYLDFAGAEPEETAAADTATDAGVSPAFEDGTLNTDEGLDICGNDKAMYIEILDEFVATYGNSDSLIENYIRSNEDVKIVQLTLDVKGVAANIGADILSEAAETLREAVLINQTEAYEKLAAEYKEDLNRVIAAIDAFKKSN